MGKRRYTDVQRAEAVTLLEANGYPTKKGALAKTVKVTRIPRGTLQSWYHQKINPPPPDIQHSKKFSFAEALETELQAIFGEMVKKREEAQYYNLVGGVKVLGEMLLALHGKSTQVITVETRHTAVDSLTDKFNAFDDTGTPPAILEHVNRD